jgi:cellulose synthase/poly-beta-1,6-N-acetylglucosamine synthase-like glycosyltransferase
MMIPILKDYYSEGYLPGPEAGALPPYFPNVNLAMRREFFERSGGYDEQCEAGEDADLCMRAARAGWLLFFEKKAHAFHEPRPDLRSLVRQWIWYGRGGSHFFFKQQQQRLEIYLNMELVPKMYRYRRVLSVRRFPFPAMLFVSAFLAGHAVAALGLLAWWSGFLNAALFLCLAACVLPVVLYFRSPLRKLSWRELWLYARFAYLINVTCILASAVAGFKKRRLFLYPGI